MKHNAMKALVFTENKQCKQYKSKKLVKKGEQYVL